MEEVNTITFNTRKIYKKKKRQGKAGRERETHTQTEKSKYLSHFLDGNGCCV